MNKHVLVSVELVNSIYNLRYIYTQKINCLFITDNFFHGERVTIYSFCLFFFTILHLFDLRCLVKQNCSRCLVYYYFC